MKGDRIWHRHKNVLCAKCGKLMWPRTTCISKRKKKRCMVPKIARCSDCTKNQLA